MDLTNIYNLIIIACVVIIVSFFFSEISKKTNIPSVLMLIGLGIGMHYALQYGGARSFDLVPILKLLGTIGLILIVLEGALELELSSEKTIPILKAFGVALCGLILSTGYTALILHYFFTDLDMHLAWLYATPISILSSAIIIPSVNRLLPHKKEFEVYESTFSDILGIMLFYFLASKYEGTAVTGFQFGSNTVLTLVLSLFFSYAIILVFQRLQSHVKLFLLISVLILLYALGKNMHLSSLIIILVFGLMISNIRMFFPDKLEKYLDFDKVQDMSKGLHVITAESAFVIRTFFFVIFGMTLQLSSLASTTVILISLLIFVLIYVIRFFLLKTFTGSDIMPQLLIAPRGLITVLLFYAIPEQAMIENFEPGILLFVIIGTSIVMTVGLIRDKNKLSRLSKLPEVHEEEDLSF